MKMSWMGEGQAVLRFEAENEMDLEVLGALFFNGPLAGAAGCYVPLEGSPWPRSTRVPPDRVEPANPPGGNGSKNPPNRFPAPTRPRP